MKPLAAYAVMEEALGGLGRVGLGLSGGLGEVGYI
jgi:hypothetical protein